MRRSRTKTSDIHEGPGSNILAVTLIYSHEVDETIHVIKLCVIWQVRWETFQSRRRIANDFTFLKQTVNPIYGRLGSNHGPATMLALVPPAVSIFITKSTHA